MSIDTDKAIELIEDIAGSQVVMVASEGFIANNHARAGLVGQGMEGGLEWRKLSKLMEAMSDEEKQSLANIVASIMKDVNITNESAFIATVNRDAALQKRITKEVLDYVKQKICEDQQMCCIL